MDLETIPAGTSLPKPVCVLVGEDGNAFAIIGAVRRALRDAGAGSVIIEAFLNEATAGDYDDLLATAAKYVDVR